MPALVSVFIKRDVYYSRVEKVPYPGILDTNWEILGSWEIFRGKKKSRKERKKKKRREKNEIFYSFPTNFPMQKSFQKFPNAKNFPTNFPMLKISQLISQS